MRVRRSRWFSPLRRFCRAKDGAAAIEFAMLAVPFLMILAATAEVGLMGFAQSTLDFAVERASREIRTGQAQEQSLTEAQMRAQICDNMKWLIAVDCVGGLHLDVDRYQSFQDVSTNTPMTNGVFNSSDMSFNVGGPSEIVMVRAYIEWQMLTPFFSQFFGNMSDGKRLLSSAMLFRNEPFPN